MATATAPDQKQELHYIYNIDSLDFIPLKPLPPPRPNTRLPFAVVDQTNPLLDSPSSFRTTAWRTALSSYPGSLGNTLADILTYGAQIGYMGGPAYILSDNLSSASRAPEVITKQVEEDHHLGRVSTCSSNPPFICSPLGLVPKHDGGERRIHHLSFPHQTSVNDCIPPEWAYLKYTTLENIFTNTRTAGRGSTIIKRDLKDAFRSVPIATSQRWLLGFHWNNSYYHENCLPFGLATAPFLFNLFAEGLHWILQHFLHWKLLQHYLDDFILILPHPPESREVQKAAEDYITITNYLGVQRNDKKDAEGNVVEVLGVEIDTNTMQARLSSHKMHRALEEVTTALKTGHLTLHKAQKLAGYLSFCSAVVTLGRTYMRRIWNFMGTFTSLSAHRPLTTAIRKDLEWWKDLLPSFNGIRLFDDTARPVFHLYTDASLQGLGAFWFKSTIAEDGWKNYACKLHPAQAFSIRSSTTEHINALELEATRVAFDRWSTHWTHGTVIIHTDSSVAFNGLTDGSLRGPAMDPLRAILLEAAVFDIQIHCRWLSSSSNALADALSRLDASTIANYCPQWNPSQIALLTTSSATPHRTNTESSSGTA